MDEAVAEEFTAPGDVVERAMYGYSTLICLPDGLSSSPSVGTGTVMRRSQLAAYAAEAGFAARDVLPIAGLAFFPFSRLRSKTQVPAGVVNLRSEESRSGKARRFSWSPSY